jgi:phytoene desaturase
VARIVVIGAGVGGLAAATRLARLGHSVTVCEAAPVVGGKLGSYHRDGFRFDTGPSQLTLPAVFRDLFRKTGKPLESVLDLRPVDPLARYRFADGTSFDAPNTGRFDFCAALDAGLGGRSGKDWHRLLERAGRMWQATRESVLENPPAGPAALLRRSGNVADLRTIAPWRSLRSLGRQYLHDPRLRMLLDRYATYTGSDPRRAPAVLATIPYVEQTFAGWYVHGGLHRLAEALADRAVQCGATIRTSTPVARVELDAGRVSGVTLADGDRLAADLVVSDVDAAHLYADLLPAPDQLSRLQRATPSLAGFVLLLGVRGHTPDRSHHTVLFPADYDAEFDAIFGPEPRPVPDPTLYVAVPDDPAVAPKGDESWFVLVNAPRHGPVDWTAAGLADSYADHLLDLLAARGLDVRDRVLFREIRTPADLERDTGAVGGAIYGSSSNGARAAFRRPANRSPVPGLFLVGGSSHPGGGLPLVAMSAAIVANMIGPP